MSENTIERLSKLASQLKDLQDQLSRLEPYNSWNVFSQIHPIAAEILDIMYWHTGRVSYDLTSFPRDGVNSIGALCVDIEHRTARLVLWDAKQNRLSVLELLSKLTSELESLLEDQVDDRTAVSETVLAPHLDSLLQDNSLYCWASTSEFVRRRVLEINADARARRLSIEEPYRRLHAVIHDPNRLAWGVVNAEHKEAYDVLKTEMNALRNLSGVMLAPITACDLLACFKKETQAILTHSIADARELVHTSVEYRRKLVEALEIYMPALEEARRATSSTQALGV